MADSPGPALVESPAAPSAPTAGERRLPPRALAAAGLVLLTLAAYAPLRHAGFVWDDDGHVTENETLRSLPGLARIWLDPRATPQYYPLVHTTFWVEYHLWGAEPLGYHAVNVLLHAANVLLVWRLPRRLAVPGAFWAAALFAVHPVHVESVAWVSERKNVLSALGYLGAALALLRFWPPEEADPRPAGRWRDYGLALLLFAAALLSKTVACTLPAAFLLVRWWKHGRITGRDVLVSVPLLVLGLALGLQTVFLETEHVGARGPEWELSAVQRVLIAGRALGFYAEKLLRPAPLIFIYPRWEIRTDVGWQYVPPLAVLAVLAVLYALRRWLGRGPLTAALFFCGTLVPALGFFNVYPMRYSFVADHFQYLASIGFLALAAAAVSVLVGRRPALRYAGGAAGVVVVGVLTGLTWRQAHAYRDLLTLWSDTLAKNPGCWMAYTNRGLLYERRGELGPALADCTRAVELRPDQAEVHHNRALVYLRLGRPGPAAEDCTRAIERRPDWPKPYGTRGLAYLQMGEMRPALADCTRAVELGPGQAGLYNNRGLVRIRLGEADEALADFARAIQLDPPFTSAYVNRGDVHLSRGQLEPAFRDYQRAAELEPGRADVYGKRGTVYLMQGRLELASQDFARGLALQPDSASLHLARALLHYTRRDYEAARADVRRGEELGGTPNPNFLRALAEASGQTR